MTIPRNQQPRTQVRARWEARPPLCCRFPANRIGYWIMASLASRNRVCWGVTPTSDFQMWTASHLTLTWCRAGAGDQARVARTARERHAVKLTQSSTDLFGWWQGGVERLPRLESKRAAFARPSPGKFDRDEKQPRQEPRLEDSRTTTVLSQEWPLGLNAKGEVEGWFGKASPPRKIVAYRS